VSDSPPSTPPPPPPQRTVQYKGAPLEAAKGPGLGCFWVQIAVLIGLVILTPLSAAWDWPVAVSAGLLVATLVILLFAGQTIIFLLRLVAADRRAEGRRRPMRSATRTVGELEDADADTAGDANGEPGSGAGPPNDGVRE
jgi:hypothetical protein